MLRTKQDSLLGKLWITGKLLYAVVIERHLHKRFGHNWNRLDQVRITTPWRLLKIVRTLIDSWVHEIDRWRPANQVACFEVLRERPRRRTLQNLQSEAVNWLKLCNKLAANSNAI